MWSAEFRCYSRLSAMRIPFYDSELGYLEAKGTNMHEAEGDLLIGGDRIKRLHVDLEAEQKQDGSGEWTLAGHLHLTAEIGRAHV